MKNLNEFAVVDYTIENYYNYCSNFTFDLQKNRDIIHPPGFHDCFIKREGKIIVMHIDKCASSSIAYELKKTNFCDMSYRIKDINKIQQYFFKNNYNFYSVIRNPKDRYISGLQEFIRRYNPSLNFIISNLEKNKFIFDEHTSPQDCFLFLCGDRCNYLKLDSDISNKLTKISNNKILLQNKNNSNKDIKLICVKLFSEFCENNLSFFDLYKKDFNLYNVAE